MFRPLVLGRHFPIWLRRWRFDREPVVDTFPLDCEDDVSALISQIFQFIMLGNCILNILELNWYQRFREKERKHWNFVIICSRRPLICKADHFTPWTRTTVKCTEMKIARVKRAKWLFSWSNMQMGHVLVAVVVVVSQAPFWWQASALAPSLTLLDNTEPSFALFASVVELHVEGGRYFGWHQRSDLRGGIFSRAESVDKKKIFIVCTQVSKGKLSNGCHCICQRYWLVNEANGSFSIVLTY